MNRTESSQLGVDIGRPSGRLNPPQRHLDYNTDVCDQSFSTSVLILSYGLQLRYVKYAKLSIARFLLGFELGFYGPLDSSFFLRL